MVKQQSSLSRRHRLKSYHIYQVHITWMGEPTIGQHLIKADVGVEGTTLFMQKGEFLLQIKPFNTISISYMKDN